MRIFSQGALRMSCGEMALKPYKLRCTLLGHSMDVRAVASAFYPEGAVVTGSRDRTTRVWTANENDQGYTEAHCMAGPTNFVSSICTLPPTPQHQSGLILVGSNDCAIYVFSLDSPQPIYKLLGHSGTVCALAAGKFGTVLSGSWDKTARVWLGQKCMMILEGHQAAVWAVQILPEQGLMLTGSADKTIRMWRAGKCEKLFSGHEDCVRGLAVLSTMEFLSCSNDATVRHWKTTGECLKIHYGHTNFIYSIAVIPGTEDFVTCSEDRTVRFWSNGECQQTICLPSQSVWAVACLENGDFVAGSSDGTARIFTCQPELYSGTEELQAFEDAVSKAALPAGVIGDLKINELPGKEILFEPGKRDGQTKLVREANDVSVHQWVAAEGRWMKIGDVVGANDSSEPTSGKVMYEGEEYDYVFTVDIEDGKPLKLPYSITEDPWFAAQKFIYKHNLNQMFLDQIANFIITNTKGITLGHSSSPHSDPFTGSSRYLPNSSQPQPANREDLPYLSNQLATKNSEGDLPSGAGDNAKGHAYFPQEVYLRFDAANTDGITVKLFEFNNEVPVNQKLSNDELTSVLQLVNAVSCISDEQMASLEKIIHWPTDKVFPALDILRLAVRVQVVNEKVSKLAGIQLTNHLLSFLDEDNPTANKMLALRTLCNLFCHSSGEALVLNHHEHILNIAKNCNSIQNKNIQVALATLYLNFAVAFHKQSDIEAKKHCLTGIVDFFPLVGDAETNFRLLVCLGTLVWGDPDTIEYTKSLEILPLIQTLQEVKNPQKVGSCAEVILEILK